MINPQQVRDFVKSQWDSEIVEEITQYIRIPAKSPSFDPDWETNGHIDAAVELMCGWARSKIEALPGARLEIVRLEGRTPVILIDVPGEQEGNVLIYGHLDKQPEMEGWNEGMGPWEPVLKDGRLYGRGGADDGYALYAAITALLALRQQRVPHARCLILIEACEESGSYDLPYYLDALSDRIGAPDLVICLDSGCGDYERLWVTTSLRGLIGGELTVEILEEGVHSGDASGVVPDSFRLARSLLSRIEDETDGRMRLDELAPSVPPARAAQAKRVAAVLGEKVWRRFPFVDEARPPVLDVADLVMRRTWHPQLAIVGASGLPDPGKAGNVLRPVTVLKLSLRLPPDVEVDAAAEALVRELERDPPSGARVTFNVSQTSSGWNAPATEPWLEEALDNGSRLFFGHDAMFMGEGGTIPFMHMLGARFPRAQFMITGVLGPQSNAHGPNEFLDLATAERITCCTAAILASHAVKVREPAAD